MRVRACVRACVHARVLTCVCACVCLCVFVCNLQGYNVSVRVCEFACIRPSSPPRSSSSTPIILAITLTLAFAPKSHGPFSLSAMTRLHLNPMKQVVLVQDGVALTQSDGLPRHTVGCHV